MKLSMINSLDSIDIRVGTPDDRDAITEFALALSEDPYTSRDKWLNLLREDNVYPLLAIYNQNIVGKIQARILGQYGWLESARVSPDFRGLGIANALVNTAIDWLIEHGVKFIRTSIESDNMSARRIVEKNHFKPLFITINPTAKIQVNHSEPQYTDHLVPVLDESYYSQIYQALETRTLGNIMVDGRYLPLTRELFHKLIEERRIYSDDEFKILLILSKHNLPSEYHGFLLCVSQEAYFTGGIALRAFGARELATITVCHAPTERNAVIGLAKAEFGWKNPHSLLVYERESWQTSG